MTFSVGDHTHPTHITSSGSHSNNASIEADVVSDLAVFEADLDGIVDLDGWVGITNPSLVNFRQHFVTGMQPRLDPTTE